MIKGVGGVCGWGILLDLLLVHAQWFPEALVKFQRDDWFGELVQVTTKDIGSVVHSVARPVQALSVPFGGIEDGLEILDTFRGAVETKDAFDIGRCGTVWSAKWAIPCKEGLGREEDEKGIPFSFKNTPHFATTIGT
jgi:hypothetical protein